MLDCIVGRFPKAFEDFVQKHARSDGAGSLEPFIHLLSDLDHVGDPDCR